MTTFFWDFFGPRAEGTAIHFHKHLQEFLQHNGLAASHNDIGTQSEGAGHCAVFCTVSPEHAPMIEKVLRPQRVR